MDLTKKHCVPCEGGTKPFDSKEIKKYLSLLKTEWELIEEPEKKIRKKDMQGHHEGMARIHQIVGHFRPEIDQTEQVALIILRPHGAVAEPGPGPVHLASEQNRQQQQYQKIIILRHREFPGRRLKSPEKKVQQADAQDQAHIAGSQKDVVGHDLEDAELVEEFQMADDQQQQGGMKQEQKDP